jgi:hypothetical protein
MRFESGKVDLVNWHNSFAWLPKTFFLDEGGMVTVWLEPYQWRDKDCAVEEIILSDGRHARNVHGS